MVASPLSAACGETPTKEHAKEVMERLAQIVREDKVSHIILAGDQVVIPLLQEHLPPEMVSMVEVMKLDIHASEQDVLTATLAKLLEQEARTAAEKGGPADAAISARVDWL